MKQWHSTTQCKQLIAISSSEYEGNTECSVDMTCLWRSVSQTMFSYGWSYGTKNIWWLPIYI